MISASTAHQRPRPVQPGIWQAHRLPRAGFWLYSRGLTLGNPPQNRPALLQLCPWPSLPRGSVCSVGASWATLEKQRAGCVGFGGGAEGPGASLRPEAKKSSETDMFVSDACAHGSGVPVFRALLCGHGWGWWNASSNIFIARHRMLDPSTH